MQELLEVLQQLQESIVSIGANDSSGHTEEELLASGPANSNAEMFQPGDVDTFGRLESATEQLNSHEHTITPEVASANGSSLACSTICCTVATSLSQASEDTQGPGRTEAHADSSLDKTIGGATSQNHLSPSLEPRRVPTAASCDFELGSTSPGCLANDASNTANKPISEPCAIEPKAAKTAEGHWKGQSQRQGQKQEVHHTDCCEFNVGGEGWSTPKRHKHKQGQGLQRQGQRQRQRFGQDKERGQEEVTGPLFFFIGDKEPPQIPALPRSWCDLDDTDLGDCPWLGSSVQEVEKNVPVVASVPQVQVMEKIDPDEDQQVPRVSMQEVSVDKQVPRVSMQEVVKPAFSQDPGLGPGTAAAGIGSSRSLMVAEQGTLEQAAAENLDLEVQKAAMVVPEARAPEDLPQVQVVDAVVPVPQVKASEVVGEQVPSVSMQEVVGKQVPKASMQEDKLPVPQVQVDEVIEEQVPRVSMQEVERNHVVAEVVDVQVPRVSMHEVERNDVVVSEVVDVQVPRVSMQEEVVQEQVPQVQEVEKAVSDIIAKYNAMVTEATNNGAGLAVVKALCDEAMAEISEAKQQLCKPNVNTYKDALIKKGTAAKAKQRMQPDVITNSPLSKSGVPSPKVDSQLGKKKHTRRADHSAKPSQ